MRNLLAFTNCTLLYLCSAFSLLQFIWSLLGTMSFCCAEALDNRKASDGSQPPNIIVIVADDLVSELKIGCLSGGPQRVHHCLERLDIWLGYHI